MRPTLARRAGVGVRDLEKLVQEMAAAWQSLEPEHDPGVDEALRSRFLGAWNEHRHIYGYTLLHELPHALRQALIEHEELEGLRYDLLVVDEYQDLNACDLDVLHRIADRGCSLVAAGDDDQSIYSFRKAAPSRDSSLSPRSTRHLGDYALSISQRCGRRIVEWSRFVIEGDPDRPERPQLCAAAGSPDGEVALLAFADQDAEAQGVASLGPEDSLKSTGSTHGTCWCCSGATTTGASATSSMMLWTTLGSHTPTLKPSLGCWQSRTTGDSWLSAGCWPIVQDSLAWATLLDLTSGIGDAFFGYIYQRAQACSVQFGQALLDAHAAGFPDAPRAPARLASGLISVRTDQVGHCLAQRTPCPRL